MALGKQQGRPVTAFTFEVATLTGEVTLLKTLVESVAVDGDDGDYTITDDSGVAGDDLQVSFNVDSGTVTINSIIAGGTGYAPDDAVSFDLSGIAGGTQGTMTAAVDTILGEVATVDTFADGTGWRVGDVVSVDELSTDGSGSGLAFTIATASTITDLDPLTGGIPTVITITAGGIDYLVDDSQGYTGSGELGISNSADFFDHTQYELGGDVPEYKTGNGLIVTVSESSGPITGLAAAVAGVDYRVGDRVAVGPTATLGTGADGIGVVATVNGTGGVLTLTVEAAGTNYDDTEDANTVFLTRKLKTDATGLYAGSNSDNDPTITVNRLADGEQWIIQKRYIDGGTIEVFAEPTTVNAYGTVVGNLPRAEEITDEYRCVSVLATDTINPLYKWVTTTAETGNKGSYGYCAERTVAELNSDSTTKADADCPAGYVSSTTTCVVVALATINTGETNWAADHSTGTDPKTAMEQCFANDGWYEPGAAAGSRCINAATGQHDNFSLSNFAFGTNSSEQDYAATVCRQMGFDWIGYDKTTPANNQTCVAKVDVTTLVTQQTCADAGHVWVAGTCYSKADFGDGYSRQGNEGSTTNKLPR